MRSSATSDGRPDNDQPGMFSTNILSDALTRRSVLKRSVGLGVLFTGISGLIAACGGDDDDDDDAATEESSDGAATTEAATEAETEEEETAEESASETEAEAETETETEEAAETEASTETEAAEETGTEEASSGDQPRGGKLVFGVNNNTDTLDPDFGSRLTDRYLMYLIYNTMVGYDVDFSIIPDLAESWDIDEPGTTINFYIREGVTFHDGTVCDANAVKRVFDRRLDPEVNSFQRSLLDVAVTAVEATDDLTVQFQLSTPFRPILAALGERPGAVQSPDALEELGEDFGRNPVGSGPFKFVEWVDDSYMLLEAYEDYWDEGMPLVDAIEIRHIPEDQVKLTALRTGEIHVADQIDPTLVSTIEGDENIEIQSIKAGRVVGLRWWIDEPPFDNHDLRKAFAYATDRQEVTDVIYGGAGGPGTHPIGGGWSYDASLEEDSISFDLDKAKEHLEASGAAGQTFTLNVSNTTDQLDLGQLLKSQYEKMDVTIELAPQNPADLNTLSQERKINWIISSWAPRADPDGLLRLLWHTEGARNMGSGSAELDQKLDEAAAIYDTDEAAPLYQEIERMIVDEVSMLFIWRSEEFAACRSNVTNFVMHPDLILRLREYGLSGE